MWFGRGTRPLPTTVLAWSQVSTLDAFDGDSNGQDDDDDNIHPKSEQIGGDLLLSTKNWRKKCVHQDDKILR